MLDTFTSFGDLLKYLRVRAQLTQRDLSIAVGYSEAQISRQENNKRIPSDYALKALFVPALGLEDEPDLVTRLLALAENAREQVRPEADADTPEKAPQSTTPLLPRHNLPRQLSSLVGREKEIQLVVKMVREHPLVTLTGAGGVGKTRLALRASQELLEDFADGVWWVELAPVVDPVFVPITVGSVLHVQSAPGQRLSQSLREVFASQCLLLILDNCEHVIDSVVELSTTLLQGCPNLKILATSRELLGVEGEYFLRCPSMSLPDFSPVDTPAATMEKAQASEAVRLFVERAQTAMPEFDLTEKNTIMIEGICRQLDGIPLAIELAAARLRLLSLDQISAGMNDMFHVLTGGLRSSLPRHRTLRAMIDWSYQLLSPTEQILLRRLSVFSGGWTLAAARAVAGGEELSQEEVLERLGQLTDKSLVIVEATEGGENRYSMLETLRQYAHEKILEAGEYEMARDRHLTFFTETAEEKCPPDAKPDEKYRWGFRLIKEVDNVRLAQEWALKNNIEMGLRLGIAYCEAVPFDRTLEFAMWLEKILVADSTERAKPGHHPKDFKLDLLHGTALAIMGDFNMLWGLQRQAERALLESLEILDEIGEPAALQKALAMKNLGTLILCSDPERSQIYLETSRGYFEGIGNIEGLSECNKILVALYLYTGQLQQARHLSEERLLLGQKTGGSMIIAYEYAGHVEMLTGNYGRAVEYFRKGQERCYQVNRLPQATYLIFMEARVAWVLGKTDRMLRLSEDMLALGRKTGHINYFFHADTIQALVEWAGGAYDQAVRRSEEGLSRYYPETLSFTVPYVYVLGRIALTRGDLARSEAYFRRVDDMAGAPRWMWKPFSLHGFGMLAAAQASKRPEMAERAAVLFGAQEKLFAWLPNLFSPLERDEYAQALAAVKVALSETAFSAAWEKGQTLSFKQAFALALEKT